MYLSEIIGQDLVKKHMISRLENDQVPHAQLIIDKNGYGGLPLALGHALLLCYSQADLKAKQEDEVSSVKLLQHSDIHFVFPVIKSKSQGAKTSSKDFIGPWYNFLEAQPYGNYANWFLQIDAGNKQGVISVYEMKLLQEKTHLKSLSGGNKVCIIWGAEKMNASAANKFLKLLEEPPEKTFFILVAEDDSSLLETIISRCQKIDLKPVSRNDCMVYLERKGITDASLLDTSQGSLRVLTELLKSENTNNFEFILVEGLRAAFRAKGNKNSVIDLMKWAEKMKSLDKEQQKSFLLYAVHFFRSAFFLNYHLEELVHFKSESGFDLNKLAPYIHAKNFVPLKTVFENAHHYLSQNANPQILFTNLALETTRLLNAPSR